MPRAPLPQQDLYWKATLMEMRGRTGTANRVRARCKQEGDGAREWNATYKAVKRTLWRTSWVGVPARPPLPAAQHTSVIQALVLPRDAANVGTDTLLQHPSQVRLVKPQ